MTGKTDLQKLSDQLPQANQGAPLPLDQWNPTSTGKMDLRIDADGQWIHEGQVIQRKSLVNLFSTILRKEEDGKFYLVTPVEKFEIDVDDAPFVAVSLEISSDKGEQQIELETSLGDKVIVDAEHPIWVVESEGQPRPYVRVRNNLDALISRNLFYQLVEMADEQEFEQEDIMQLSIRSSGEDFVLGRF